jgi:hypothetical protein
MLSLSLMLALGVQRTSVDSSGFGGGSGTPPPSPPPGHGNARSAQGKRAYVGVWGRLMYNGHLFYDHAATEGAYRHSRAPAAHPKLSYTYTAYAPTLAPPPSRLHSPPLFYDTKCNTLRAIFICVLAGIATISILD